MTAPRILGKTQTTENTDHAFTKYHGNNLDAATLILLRNLQTQITDLEARVDTLENP